MLLGMRRLAWLILLVSACGPSRSRTPAPPAPEATTECRPVDTSASPEITRFEEGGVTVHSFVAPEVSARSASHIVETNAGLVIIDTQLFRDYAEQFHDYARGLGKPITHVIVSHGHPDHYLGLEYFESYPTYALPQTRVDMKQRHKFHLNMHRVTEGECDAVADRVRFVEHDLELGERVIGGVTFVFENVVDAEDNDQLVVRLPQAQTIIVQDLLATDVHAYTGGGMLDSWIASLRTLESQGPFAHVLVGHGSPVGHDGLSAMVEYLETSAEVYTTATTGGAFREAMVEAYPERGGLYLLNIIAKIKFADAP